MAVTFIRGLNNLPPKTDGVVATIGTFDGVHRGHQAMMAQVRERSAHYGLPSTVILFEPHPREFFLGDQAPAKLMRLREKIVAIQEQQIDQIFCLSFNERLRSTGPEHFVKRILVDELGLRCLIVGDDFRFGRNGRGNSVLLEEAGRKYDFEVIDTATVEFQGRRISSTWVREALDVGDFELAEALLGKRYSISGRVMHGQKLGSKLGVPTANVNLKRQRAPLSGVYIVEVVLDNTRLPAVANVGVRPTVGDLEKPILEVHILDWTGDIYRRHINVEFRQKIREERRFQNVEELLEWIHKDIQTAKDFFA